MIPTAPPALLEKLRTVDRQQLLSPHAAVPVPSPCVSVCQMDADRHYCIGCLRTLEELCAWGNCTAEGKRAIWQRVRERSQIDT